LLQIHKLEAHCLTFFSCQIRKKIRDEKEKEEEEAGCILRAVNKALNEGFMLSDLWIGF
jgi:hypothetical protein